MLTPLAYTCMCIYSHTRPYKYIHKSRGRERERERGIIKYMAISKHIVLHCFLDMACGSLVSLKQNRRIDTAEK